jgi:tetratricopeptide (TPR) repeat protein
MLLSKAYDTMFAAGWSEQFDTVVGEAIEDDESIPHVGRLWVERAASRNDDGFEKKLDELLERGEIGQEALLAVVEALGKPASAARLHQCIARYDKLLRETNRAWAKTAQALVEVRDWALAAAWVADWDRRDPKEPWMLHPAALTFRMLNRLEEAYAASRKALMIPVDDTTTPDHQVWVALEDALNGRAAEAAALLHQVEPEDLDDLPRLFFVLAETLAAVQRAVSNRSAAFSEAKRKAEEALANFAPKEANEDLTRTYRRWTARIAKDAGGLSAWAWGVWKKFRPSL